MTKYDKEMKVAKPADLKKVDPEVKVAKAKKKRKIYPLHWEVRGYGVTPSKYLKSDTSWHRERSGPYYVSTTDYKEVHRLIDLGLLDEALEIYTKHHPETKDWPVRFIGIQPMKTIREVIE